jgi:uncharacterized membrane protein
MNSTKLKFLIPLLAFAGFLDATYLTVKHYTGGLVPCTTAGCEQVLNSAYATILNVPLSLFGAGYYLAVLVLAVAYLEQANPKLLKLILALVGLGMLFTVYLTSLQLFVIQAICLYCMFSAATTACLLGLAVWQQRIGK